MKQEGVVMVIYGVTKHRTEEELEDTSKDPDIMDWAKIEKELRETVEEVAVFLRTPREGLDSQSLVDGTVNDIAAYMISGFQEISDIIHFHTRRGGPFELGKDW